VAVPGPAPRNVDQEYLPLFRPPRSLRGRLVVRYSYYLPPIALPSDRLVVYNMWASTQIPPEIVDAINDTASLCCVPCRQNVEMFRDAGVRIPLQVLPHGVDGERFPLLNRPRHADDPFVFGTISDGSYRKGIDVLVRAFRGEFAPHEPVRLILKNSGGYPVADADDPRIEQFPGLDSQADLLPLLGRMDAFVLPSRGEGFGLTGLEAMATGLPVIATNWSGPADYLDLADSLPLDYRLVDAPGTTEPTHRFDGLWAEPDEAHLRHLLRWAYAHRDEAAAMGRRAADRVRRDWTWDRAARILRDDLDALAAGFSPA
jgi:glycosyltransferase involved in cell wall biosynthesis